MMKMTVLISMMLIGIAWCACDSCGPECARACGTRRFRPCCFNYLRRKRVDADQSWSPNAEENLPKSEVPAIIVRYLPNDVMTKILSDNLIIPDDMQD